MRLLKERVLEGWYGRPDNSNTLLVRTRDELTIVGYDVLGAHLFVCRSERETGEQDVIDPQAHENIFDPRLGKEVPFEPRHPRFPECRAKWTGWNQRAVMQQPISDVPEIQHTKSRRCSPAFCNRSASASGQR